MTGDHVRGPDAATPALLAELGPLLAEALDLPPDARPAWLDALRTRAPTLAAEIGALLGAEARLDQSGFLSSPGPSAAAPPPLAGRRLGAYTLERPVGRGGMGTVWLARRSDGRYEGRVAVKLLNLALLDAFGAERFRREGTALARLTHRNIARLLDAGVSDDGQPFLVLEYVEGRPIDAYCESAGLAPERRIALFQQVLAAVAHAHANLVVHRDLKPSNVLVTADGEVKLLDFGIAKLLHDGPTETERAELTSVGDAPMTPEYAAPEQVSGDPVTPATDLYALGVLLYVLLTGRHPTGSAGDSAVARLRGVVETDPRPLSAAAPDRLRRAYRGDLDNIVARALEKRPADRYATAAAFAEDVRRYQAHEPVLARRGSPVYRAAKFARRNRIAVAAAVLVLLEALVAVATDRTRHPDEDVAGPPVLAVLPFENLGPPGTAYFADGLTDEVRARLTGISGLRVIGGTSARQYEGTTKPAREIARELGATHLLTATVQWERGADSGPGRVRVSAELVRATDGASVWAEPVEAPLEDVFRLQASVAEQVADALDVGLLADERRTVKARPTANVAAYDAFLRGLAALERGGRSSSAEARLAAVAELERATRLDPAFAAAYARLSEAFLAIHYVVADPATLEKARANAARAWALDSTLLESRLARAEYLTAAGDPAAAYQVASAAALATPGAAEAQLRLAQAEDALGRPERGIPSAARAGMLDPRSEGPPAVLAGLYQKTYRHAESIRVRERELALAPRTVMAYWYQMICYLGWRADTAGARRVMERGGPALEAWLVRLPNDPGAYALWHQASGPSVWRAQDTLSFAGYLANDGGFPPELYLLMKLRHAAFTGRPDLVRAYADSTIARLEPALRRKPDVSLYNTYSRRSMLAEGYARLGRAGDAAREIDRYVAEARDQRLGDALPIALVNGAYVDVLIGRGDLAVARLTEALRLPSGQLISRALLRAEPAWAPLHAHPGFERLVAGG